MDEGHDERTSLDERWRRLTADAHSAWANGDETRARRLYEDALAEADAIFSKAVRSLSIEACVGPLLYTISSHNLAELARRHGDLARSSELVAEAVARLVSIAESTAAPLVLRSSCVRNLEPALAELVADLGRRNLAGAAVAPVERARAAAARVRRESEGS
jgi:hypothetical protein